MTKTPYRSPTSIDTNGGDQNSISGGQVPFQQRRRSTINYHSQQRISEYQHQPRDMNLFRRSSYDMRPKSLIFD